MKSKILLLLLSVLVLNACVEVKNPDEDQDPQDQINTEPKQEVVQPMNNLIVDQPMYLYEGQVYNQTQFAERMKIMPASEVHTTYRFDNLEIKQEGVIYTVGQDLRLEIKNLISEGSIQSFPEGSVAKKEQNGRNGGHLDMAVETSSGSLDIIMRGQHGGQGKDGTQPDDSLRGASGVGIDCFSPESHGKKGLMGYPGQAGKKGGNSGSVNYYKKDATGIIPRVMGVVGSGGTGGSGGAGGAQGLDVVKCGWLYPIRKPQQSERGHQGAMGTTGSLEQSRLIIGDQIINL